MVPADKTHPNLTGTVSGFKTDGHAFSPRESMT